MNHYNVDGLPGLTMQGTKGDPGKRGYTTFYRNSETYSAFLNTDSSTEIFEGNDFTLGFVDNDSDGVLDTVIPIPLVVSSISPIEHDYIIDNEVSQLVLYEVTSVHTVNIINDASNNLSDSLDAASILFINSTLSDYASGIISDSNYYSFLSSYEISILRWLDTWTYSKKKTSILNDIEVTVASKEIKVPKWLGTYKKFDDAACSGHTFTRSSETIFDKDDQIKAIKNSTNRFCVGEMLSGNIYDSSTGSSIASEEYPVTITLYSYTNSEMQGDLLGNLSKYNIICSSETNITETYLASQESDDGTYSFDFTSGYIGIPTQREEATAMLLEAKCSGYLTSYYLLADLNDSSLGTLISPDYNKLNIYLIPNESGTEVDSMNTVKKTDYYSYINTSKPETSITVSDASSNLIEEEQIDVVTMTRFEIFSSLSTAEKKKICIFAELTSGNTKCTYRPSAIDGLWKNEEENLRIEDNYEHPYGLAKNYSQDLNFDNEYPENFTLVIKDFDEGNEKQVFLSTKLLPSTVMEYNYTIELFAYYKTSNAGYQKIYLGRAGFADTLE